MKTWTLPFCILPSAFSLRVWVQYALDWSTVDGGGVCTVSGPIGQPDAGTLSGGNYTLQGGFWGIISAVQTPGAPTLTIQRAGNSVVISWPLPADGWNLRESSAVTGTGVSWDPTAQARTTNSTTISVTVPSPSGLKFYRLQKP